MPETNCCPKCDGPAKHIKRYDAYACRKCNVWAESKCNAWKQCQFCKTRPRKPWTPVRCETKEEKCDE